MVVWVRAILPQLLGQPLVYDSSRAPQPAPGAWTLSPLFIDQRMAFHACVLLCGWEQVAMNMHS